MNDFAARSYLFVPSSNETMLLGADSRGADVLILDLEDSVGRSSKEQARLNLKAYLDGYQGIAQLWVRINSDPEESYQDLAIAVHPRVSGIVPSKVESSNHVNQVAEVISDFEKISNIEGLKLMPLIESAAGVLKAPEIAKSQRVLRLAIGEEDLAADLLLSSDYDESVMTFARNSLLYASRAAHIGRPVGPVALDFQDLLGLQDSTEALRRSGFFGRLCIHPAQIPIINEVFMASESDKARAKRILELLEISHGAATTDDSGSMIDQAHAKWANAIMENQGR